MNKDYLTSPFNDKNLNAALSTAHSLQQHNEAILSVINGIPKIDLSHVYTISDNTLKILNDTLSAPYLQDALDSIHTASRVIQSFTQPNYLHQIQEITKNYSNLIKAISTPYQNLDLSNILTDFESFIKEESKNPNQEPKQSCSQINSKSEENIKTESDKVENLYIAFINFEFHAERFKEVFHKSYSYASERKVVVFGVANAFTYLVTSAAQVHPLLPFWIFSIVSVIGLFTPKD